MRTSQAIVAVLRGKPGSIPVADKVGLRRTLTIPQASPHDLFHLSLVKVNAWPKTCHTEGLAGNKQKDKPRVQVDCGKPLMTLICTDAGRSGFIGKDVKDI
jgi:hypothetical protein